MTVRRYAPFLRAFVGLAGAFVGFASCFTGSEGLLPPSKSLYFPTGMTISPGRTALYVTNSDFDLQYNGGTVQVANLIDHDGQPGMRTLAETVGRSLAEKKSAEDACAAIGTVPNESEFLNPGPCAALPFSPFVRSFAAVGAFTTAALLVHRVDGEPGARLFVPVRGDPSITYFDVTDDRDPANPQAPCNDRFCLDCDASGDDFRCGDKHRIGENPYVNLRGLTLPTEPVGIDAAQLAAGDALVVAHQTRQIASLIVNRWPGAAPIPDVAPSYTTGPALEFLLDGLDDGPAGVVHIPPPAYVAAIGAAGEGFSYRQGFVVSHRAAPTLTVLRFEDDTRSRPERPFLTRTDQILNSLTNDGADSRGMAIDASERQACEALCDGGETGPDTTCLGDCAEDVPLRFYMAGRAPSSLVIGTIELEIVEQDGEPTSVTERLSLDDLVPLQFGASAVAVGQIINKSGERETRVFTVAFDSRFVVGYDPALRRVDTFIQSGRGPFGIAFDTGPDETGELISHMYLGHFTDSYISVVDLDARRPTYGVPLVNFGPPVSPREEQ
jgi:hypothetical protein